MNKISISRVKILFIDFDGVLTDNKVIVNEKGIESVVCSRSDSLYFNILKKQFGLKIIILSTEKNPVVKQRAKKLKVLCFQNISNKADFIRKFKKKEKLKNKDLLYIGNDINDLHAMLECEHRLCPSDSSKQIKKISNIILKTKGGQGVISEIFDYFIEKIDYSVI